MYAKIFKVTKKLKRKKPYYKSERQFMQIMKLRDVALIPYPQKFYVFECGRTTTYTPDFLRRCDMKMKQSEVESRVSNGFLDREYQRQFAEGDKGETTFNEYVGCNFQNIDEEFKGHLTPSQIARVEAVSDLACAEYPSAFEVFLWEILDKAKLTVLIEAYCESNHEEFKEWLYNSVGGGE